MKADHEMPVAFAGKAVVLFQSVECPVLSGEASRVGSANKGEVLSKTDQR